MLCAAVLGAALCSESIGAPQEKSPAISAPAAPGEASRFAGTWRYAGGEAEIAKLDVAIESVVQRMNFFIRGIARRRLRAPNLPSQFIGIAVRNGRLAISRPGRPEVTSPADGTVIDWVDPDGERFRVSQGAIAGVLFQRFEGSRSLAVNHFVLDGDARRMTVETTITSKHLPAPLHFFTTYQKQ